MSQFNVGIINSKGSKVIRLFMDESGECSFSENSICRHFLITIISVDPAEIEQIKKSLKRIYGKIIKKGWDKRKEPKAYELFKDKRFGKDTMEKILEALLRIPSLKINYIIVNKRNIINQSFRNAPYGTAYNYFTGVLLTEMIFDDGLGDVYLIYDQKNKETHANKHFREYLETKIYGTALEKEKTVSLRVKALESHNCYGLLAVDYFSWVIFRNFEAKDRRFFDLIKGSLGRRREWYIN